MLRRLIARCLARRPMLLVAFLAFLGLGYAAFTTLNPATEAWYRDVLQGLCTHEASKSL